MRSPRGERAFGAGPANDQIAARFDVHFDTRALGIEERDVAPVGNVEVTAQQVR